MSDFNEVLIVEVKQRTVLWDIKNKHHHNRATVDREWETVADVVGDTKEIVKTRWKNLRDTFRKEVKKIRRSNLGNTYSGTWPYYNDMIFLQPVLTMIPRRTEGKFSILIEPQELVHNDRDPLEDTAIEKQKHAESFAKETNDSIKKRKIIVEKRSAPMEKELHESPKLTKVSDENDEDFSFFKSLMPHLKRLPAINKLYFRSQVQNLLAEELSKLEQIVSSNYEPSSSSNLPMTSTTEQLFHEDVKYEHY